MGMIAGQNPQNVAGFFTKTEKLKDVPSRMPNTVLPE